MTKDQKDIKLLDKSIAHWKRMREWTLEQWKEYAQNDEFPERCSPGNCALCNKYFKTSCLGCPVCGENVHRFCVATPYCEADVRFEELERGISLSVDEKLIESRHKSWQHAADQEIAFLAKLRDELKKKVACQARNAKTKKS